MTDGIIHKVIRNHAHIQDGNEEHCNECIMIHNIEQELIKKIKQECLIDVMTGKHSIIDIDKLIGDNNNE